MTSQQSEDVEDAVRKWAAALAAELPPFTASEAAAVGQLAAVLDARHGPPVERAV